MISQESCWDELRKVIDPEIYENIIDLGLVYNVTVQPDEAVDVEMTLTTPQCPLGPQIIADVERTLQAHGARDVNVNIVWQPMWTPDAMTDDLKRKLGILEEEPEPVVELPPPPPPAPRKKGLFARLFGG
ncbi:MAG: metal-sulfur cluster assembly factor [Caldilineaceae bacterium]|nr:metal-sulfur cluster assembly factor [Caldilineaceae bacterium]MCB9138253.1 metal-sulfur cluster assembly factor [Caldilineaceae bacterium]